MTRLDQRIKLCEFNGAPGMISDLKFHMQKMGKGIAHERRVQVMLILKIKEKVLQDFFLL